MYRGFNKNASGYSDPTAAAALSHIVHEEKVKRRRERNRADWDSTQRDKPKTAVRRGNTVATEKKVCADG